MAQILSLSVDVAALMCVSIKPISGMPISAVRHPRMTDSSESQSLDFTRLRAGYRTGGMAPWDVVAMVYERIAARGDDGVWIHVVPRAEAESRAGELESLPPDVRASLPLYGLPFGIKDCIDVAGMPTTAACPAFSYIATETNPTVARLLDAGAIPDRQDQPRSVRYRPGRHPYALHRSG